MNRLVMPVAVMMVFLLTGCGIFGSSKDGSNDVSVYSGETSDYSVEVRIVEGEGQCKNRRITLQRLAKLHVRPTVQRVVAHDHRCDEQIDNLEFRDPDDSKRIDRSRLIEDIWHAFYQIVPIERHMGRGGA